jgi:hypothetical protein
MDASELLLEKYLEMQQKEGERISLKAFSERIGIDDKYLNHVINGRRKLSERLAITLANYFKDPRFYDAAGLPRPEPMLSYVIRHWGELSPEAKDKIGETTAQYTTESPPDG